MTKGQMISDGKFITEHERAEDLLKNIYDLEKDGNAVYVSDLKQKVPLTRREQSKLVAYLQKKDMITVENQEEGDTCLLLTEKGKDHAAQISRKHDQLTDFLRIICNVSEEVAASNAHRIEHIISNEIISGIKEFMREGHSADRIIRNQDLGTIYEQGEYEFDFAMYENEDIHPLIYARENSFFEDSTRIRISKNSDFELELKDADALVSLWYYDGERWKKAVKNKNIIRIPSSAFVYCIGGLTRMITAGALVAALDHEGMPHEEDFRTVKIHIW